MIPLVEEPHLARVARRDLENECSDTARVTSLHRLQIKPFRRDMLPHAMFEFYFSHHPRENSWSTLVCVSVLVACVPMQTQALVPQITSFPLVLSTANPKVQSTIECSMTLSANKQQDEVKHIGLPTKIL